MPKRNAVRLGDFSFSLASEGKPGILFGVITGTLSIPYVVYYWIWSFSTKQKFYQLEQNILEAGLDAISKEQREPLSKQLKRSNYFQSSYLKTHAETYPMRWRPWGFKPDNRHPIPKLNCEASILATVSFKVNGQRYNSDLLCAWGTFALILTDGDIYDARKSLDFELLNVDAEPVEIDSNGRFVRSLLQQV